MTTRAPSPASACAIASPMPLAAPVTSAVRPASVAIASLPTVTVTEVPYDSPVMFVPLCHAVDAAVKRRGEACDQLAVPALDRLLQTSRPAIWGREAGWRGGW